MNYEEIGRIKAASNKKELETTDNIFNELYNIMGCLEDKKQKEIIGKVIDIIIDYKQITNWVQNNIDSTQQPDYIKDIINEKL